MIHCSRRKYNSCTLWLLFSYILTVFLIRPFVVFDREVRSSCRVDVAPSRAGLQRLVELLSITVIDNRTTNRNCVITACILLTNQTLSPRKLERRHRPIHSNCNMFISTIKPEENRRLT